MDIEERLIEIEKQLEMNLGDILVLTNKIDKLIKFQNEQGLEITKLKNERQIPNLLNP